MGLAGHSVCIVGVNYAPEITGIAPYTTALARHLVGLGAIVEVITGVPHYPEWGTQPPYDHGLRWEERDHGVRVRRRRHTVPSRPGLWGRAAYEASFFASAAPAVLRSGAEAVIAVTPSVSAVALGALVSGLRRRPLGALVQDLVGNAASESGTTRSGAASMISRGEYALLRRADLVGVITPRFGEIVVHNGVAPERLFALPNFTHIRRSSLDKATARTLLGWPPGRILVVHTGNMGMKQGLETVVDAAAIATSASPGVDFIFVGDGNQRAVLEHRATGLPNVRFVDPLAPEQYPHALAAADILLVNERASVREMSLPSKLTSYLAAGRPVIAAVVPEGITEQAAQHCGGCLVIPAGDPEALLAAVARLGDDTMLAGALAVAGRRFAAGELGADAALGRYANFTQRLLDFSSTAAR